MFGYFKKKLWGNYASTGSDNTQADELPDEHMVESVDEFPLTEKEKMYLEAANNKTGNKKKKKGGFAAMTPNETPATPQTKKSYPHDNTPTTAISLNTTLTETPKGTTPEWNKRQGEESCFLIQEDDLLSSSSVSKFMLCSPSADDEIEDNKYNLKKGKKKKKRAQKKKLKKKHKKRKSKRSAEPVRYVVSKKRIHQLLRKLPTYQIRDPVAKKNLSKAVYEDRRRKDGLRPQEIQHRHYIDFPHLKMPSPWSPAPEKTNKRQWRATRWFNKQSNRQHNWKSKL